LFRLLPCHLIDLSDNGARLEVGALGNQLREPFDFSFDNFRTIRSARRAWSNGWIAGIEFI